MIPVALRGLAHSNPLVLHTFDASLAQRCGVLLLLPKIQVSLAPTSIPRPSPLPALEIQNQVLPSAIPVLMSSLATRPILRRGNNERQLFRVWQRGGIVMGNGRRAVFLVVTTHAGRRHLLAGVHLSPLHRAWLAPLRPVVRAGG